MEYIPNQPVSFSTSPTYYNALTDCANDEVPYNQLVQNTDQTQFQISIAPCPDAVDIMPEPTFDSDDGWDLPTNWGVSDNKLCATTTSNIAETTVIFNEGYYRIKLVVESWDNTQTGILEVRLDGVNLQEINSAGTYYVYGFSPVGGSTLELVPTALIGVCFTEISAYLMSLPFDVKIFNNDEPPTEVATIDYVTNPEYFTFAGDTLTVTIDWAALGVVNQCAFLMLINSCDGSQLISNRFKIGDYSEMCTLLINACNNNNSFGFVFIGSDFSPRLRIEAKLRQSTFASETSIFEDSGGTKGAYYFARRKSKSLSIAIQPEYIHDFLSTLKGYDTFYIGGVPYFVDDDEYSPVYGDNDNFATVIMSVSEKTQNVKNILCTDNVTVCNLAE